MKGVFHTRDSNTYSHKYKRKENRKSELKQRGMKIEVAQQMIPRQTTNNIKTEEYISVKKALQISWE